MDSLGKLALPLVTAIVAFTGTFIASRINRENNVRQTINQREQAESSLRTSMFSELVSSFIGDPSKANEDRPQYLALLAELLALNFHEHFELGPLMAYVDELPNQTAENRSQLRSVARRIVSRQIAVLGRPSSADAGKQCGGAPTDVEFWLISDAGEPVDEPLECKFSDWDNSKSALLQCAVGQPIAPDAPVEPDPLIRASSADCEDRLSISITELDWMHDTAHVHVTMEGAESTDLPEFVDFTLSPYALPFSDNTLLPSGNRFGIYIRQVEESNDGSCGASGCDPTLRLMRLSLVWFPKDFIPPRERPTDFTRIRRSLKL